MSVSTLSFGCRLNALEVEVMQASAQEAGLDNVLLVNSCAVTAEAVRQTRQAIRKAKREHPDRRIVVSGCAAQIEPETFARMHEVDFVIGNGDKLAAPAYAGLNFGLETAEKIRVNDIMSVTETAGHMVEGMAGRTRAFVQVQNGCDHRCTFCIIPFGRGPSRSVPMGAVVDQVRALVDNGYLEVVLTGVDLTSYGPDLPGRPVLGQLVQEILGRVPDLPRLRISSIDCIEVDEALIDAFGSETRLMPHLHLSLQSGADMILKRMKRRHLRDQAIVFCQRMQKVRPDMVFGADLIAGFPTETDEMFEDTVSILGECNIVYAHIFPYSPRPGTPAARMPQVDGAIIKQRAKALRQAGQRANHDFMGSLVGSRQTVLLERENLGRTAQFAQVHIMGDPTAAAGTLAEIAVLARHGAGLVGQIVGEGSLKS
ncbi:MAG: tRNA (N(6)-L-threonylcarbamoyladenosine(37)-C(2))-methylthiotransferase MtaB [Alphaproteobacteria bacterium]|nr:tRNA (N(6)-L-threonylcarbamoyladenosine(37)-C(2))-methylthiotransferase MtaB [Alphaproteobacteria bacterium]